MRRQFDLQRLLADASLLAAMTMLLAAGYQSQFYVFKVFSENTPSIYESAFGTGYTSQPPLSAWLEGIVDPFYIGLSATVLMFSLGAANAWALAIRVAAVSFCLFVTGDMVATLQVGGLSVGQFLVIVSVDGVASLLLAFSFVGVLATVDTVLSTLNVGAAGKVLGGAGTVIACLLILATSHFAVSAFFQPLAVNIDLILNRKTHGYVFSEDNKESRVASASREERSFAFVRGLKNTGSVNWRHPEGPFQVQWTGVKDPKYDIDIAFFGGCWDPLGGQETPGAPNWVMLEDVKSLMFVAEFGMANFILYGGDDGAQVTFSQQRAVQFSIDNSGSSDRIDVTQSSIGNEIVSSTGTDRVRFYGAMLPYDVHDKKFIKRDIDLRIVTDSVAKAVRIFHDGSPDTDRKVKCKALDSPSILKRGSLDAAEVGELIGVLFTIRLAPGSDVSLESWPNTIIEGASGWLTAEQAAADELGRSDSNGKIKSFIVGANASQLSMNGATLNIVPSDSIFAMGDFTAEFGADGRLRYIGHAMAITKNNVRLNPTRWEALSDGMQIAAVSGLIVGFLGLFGWVLRVFAKHPSLSVLEAR